MDSHFIPLGSGEVLPWETHPSLTVLHQLKLFHFPIPNGIVLIAPAFTPNGLRDGFLENLEEEIRQRELKTNLTLVAYAYDEKGSTFSRPLTLETLNADFIDAIHHLAGSQRIDFLILEAVLGEASGRAFSQVGFYDDFLEFQLGLAIDPMPVTTIPIGKMAAGESLLRGDFRGRVQELLRSIRKALGEDNWIVGWTDTGEAIFMTSIERLVSPLENQDLYCRVPLWETWVETSNPLQESLILASSSKLFQYFHHWAPELWDSRPFVISKDGLIQFNASLLNDFMRSFGLSTASLKILFQPVFSLLIPWNSVRFWRSLPRLFRFVHELSLGPGIANRAAEKLSDFRTTPEKPFSELFQEWQNVFVSSSHALYRLSSLNLLVYYPEKFFRVPKVFHKKAKEAEESLRSSTKKAMMNIEQAIQVKALGWYSRNLISSDVAIWSYTSEQILAIENELE